MELRTAVRKTKLECDRGGEFWFGQQHKMAHRAHMEDYMKNLRRVIVLAGLVAMVAVIPAAAQNTWNDQRLDVAFTAPTAFYVGDAKMPAGSYHITQGGVGQENMLLVRADKGKHEALVQFDPVSTPKPLTKTEVTFNKYGGNEYLNSVAFGSLSDTQSSWVLKINPSAGEQAAAKAAQAEQHTVAATKK